MPGEVGIWVFIFGDMLLFSTFFCVFLYYRAQDISLFFNAQQTLSQLYGGINTVILLTSSWFVVQGLGAVRRNQGKAAGAMFVLAFLCGFAFSVIKILEWSEKISQGITLVTNNFYMYYFIFTGIHMLHVVFGLIVLGYMYQKTKARQFGAQDIQTFESGAAYWHLVDLLWIVLFTLLYLVT